MKCRGFFVCLLLVSFHEVQLIIFSFMIQSFRFLPKKSLLTQMLQRYLICFLSETLKFLFLHLSLWSNSILYSVWSRHTSSFFFFFAYLFVSPPCFWKYYSIPIEFPWCFVWISIHIYVLVCFGALWSDLLL